MVRAPYTSDEACLAASTRTKRPSIQLNLHKAWRHKCFIGKQEISLEKP